ncbi:hypothetical protein FG735_24230, partial [Salmonella enterica subsp. enterica serovar Hadar]
SCKLNELVSVAANNRLHRNIEEVENLNETEEARLMAGAFCFSLPPRKKQSPKHKFIALEHNKYKKNTL